MSSFLACQNNNQQPQEPGYTLTGTLKGIDTGSVKLMVFNDEITHAQKIIDSGAIKDHQFKLQGKIGVPRLMYLLITPGNWKFPVFVEDTTLSITADTAGSEYFDQTAYGGPKGADIDSVTETGSKNYDDWVRFQKDPGQKQYYAVSEDLYKQFKEQAAKGDKDAEYKVRDKMDSVRKLLQAWQKKKINEYISEHPGSVAGIYMFYQLYLSSQDFPTRDLDSTLQKFQGAAAASVYYRPMADDLAKKKAVLPGSIAPDFTLLKRDSSKFTLSGLRGKVHMIDFWASWCHPCRQAIPHWKKVYAKYHDKGFEMVSVSDDFKWPDWFKAMDQEKMPWTQVCDDFNVKNMPARVGSLYMTTYIPFYVLLDKEGKILVYSGKEEDIDNKLKELFGS